MKSKGMKKQLFDYSIIKEKKNEEEKLMRRNNGTLSLE